MLEAKKKRKKTFVQQAVEGKKRKRMGYRPLRAAGNLTSKKNHRKTGGLYGVDAP